MSDSLSDLLQDSLWDSSDELKLKSFLQRLSISFVFVSYFTDSDPKRKITSISFFIMIYTSYPTDFFIIFLLYQKYIKKA